MSESPPIPENPFAIYRELGVPEGEWLQLEQDKLLYGNCFILKGRRVDPRGVKPGSWVGLVDDE